MSYYLKIISLKGCPYSQEANNLVKDNNIDSDINIIEYSQKDNFKTDDISTFPQVYLTKRNSKGSALLGGYSELKEYFDIVNNNSNIDNIKKKITKNLGKENMSDKAILRLIELLRSK